MSLSTKWVGAHVDASEGMWHAPHTAALIGARSYSFFTKPELQWFAKSLDQGEIEQFVREESAAGFLPEQALPHDSFLINLCYPEEKGLARSRKSFLYEMKRVEALGLVMLNFHPGSTLDKIPESEALALVAQSINFALAETARVTAVIENTAGQGSYIGYSFEQLRGIIDLVDDKSRVGVCLDTCHAFAAGYDLRTAQSCEKVFQEFDDIVGLEYLRGMHLNDSKKDIGTKVDRHETIGKGYIGLELFRYIMNDVRFDKKPLILETPDPSLWEYERNLLYSLEA